MYLAGLPVPGGVSERLWSECQVEAFQSLLHPFVVSLAAGTLPRETFRHYVAQDTFYLQHFAAAYRAALAKAKDDAKSVIAMEEAAEETSPVVTIQKLLEGVYHELQLHESYAAKWGLTAQEVASPSPATQAYTDFLLSVADDPKTSVAEVLAAMVPCSRLYGFLGCTLAVAFGKDQPRHAFSDWVDTYSSRDYLECPEIKEKLLDRLAYQAPYDRLKKLYQRAMQLEVDFFSAQPNTPPARSVGMLVVDFDDTCSQGDTISILLSAAVEARARAAAAAGSGDGATAAAIKEQLQAEVKALAVNYVNKQKALLAEILPGALQRAGTTAATAAAVATAAAAGSGGGGQAVEFDGEQLTGFLEKLSDFDTQMNQVVVEAGVLAGLTGEDIGSAAGCVQLQAGCRGTLASAAAAGVAVHVLSANWSSSMVAAALGLPAHIAQLPDSPSTPSHHEIIIHANELVQGPDGKTTGDILRNVENARDKGLLFEELLLSEASQAALARHGNGNGNGRGCTVFVGDSVSDILPLLQADYGIVVGSNSQLRRVLQQFNIQLHPLCTAPLLPPGTADPIPVLYEANSWAEVQAFILGPPPVPTTTTTSSSSSSGVGMVAENVVMNVHTSKGDTAAAARSAGGGGGMGVNGVGQAYGLQKQQQQVGHVARVLTVAGSDSGGGAGVQADLKAILALGGFGMSAVTAVTAQNTAGVQGVHVIPADMLAAQLDSVLGDLGVDVVKTGMLPDADTVKLVASKLREHGVDQLVVDPVMISTSGHALAGGGVAEAIITHLFPLATVITPNIVEAATLLGGMSITSIQDMQAAAQKLQAMGPRYVLVKGGHLVGHQYQQQRQQLQAAVAPQAVDVLCDGQTCWTLTSPAVASGNLHGTGCTLASALAAALAQGRAVPEAARTAKAYLTSVLEGSVEMRLGAGPQRPFNHGVGLTREGLFSVGCMLQVVGQQQEEEGLQQQQGLRQLNTCDLRVYVVTDAGCNKRTGRRLVDAVKGAVAGGATVVQIREKEIDGGDFVKEAAEVIQLCRPLGIPVIINDRVDVALVTDADGVHVGQSDIPAAAVRKMLGPNKILGVSVKTPAEALQAEADGADYLGCGAVYPTGTKASDVIGVEGFKAVCEATRLPVVSIGGVGASNAGETLAAGAAGVAVVSAVFGAPDVAAATRELREAVDASLGQVAPAAEAAAAAVVC